MPDYRLYRLNELGRVLAPAVEIEVQDDAAAVAKAIELDHAYVIEIWSGARLVSRVDPNH